MNFHLRMTEEQAAAHAKRVNRNSRVVRVLDGKVASPVVAPRQRAPDKPVAVKKAVPKPKKAQTKVLPADHGKALNFQLRAVGISGFLPEVLFAQHIGRRWRFDLASRLDMVAVEIEGGIWTRGRHTRGDGYLKDMEKYNAATVMGWRLIRVTPQQVDSGEALKLIQSALDSLI